MIDFSIFIQDVGSDFNASTIISILVGVSALGAAVYKGLTWYSKQNENRALVIKKALEDQAKIVKDTTETKAKEIKETAEASALVVKKSVDDSARDVKRDLETNTQLLKDKILGIEQIVASLTVVVKDNFHELAKRADLTNGNVASIRNDLSDLANDVQDLFEMVDPQSESKEAVKVSREKDGRRRERKRQIEADRIAQLHQGEKAYGR